MLRQTPPPCPICGAAHTTCSAGSGPITVQQTPARDAAAAALDQPPLVAEVEAVGLGDGTDGRPYSTATYRGKHKR